MISLTFILMSISATPYSARPGISEIEVQAASVGCLDCHQQTDSMSMHQSEAVALGCAHCHGGDPSIRKSDRDAKNRAHIAPNNPQIFKNSANPKNSYAEFLKESPAFVRFVNPGDLRVVAQTCSPCHLDIVQSVERSLMTTSAMLWGGASYNNNILPNKRYLLGESYTEDGSAREIQSLYPVSAERRRKGALEKLIPLPQWEVLLPGDVFRIFERGGQNIRSSFPEIGNPNPLEESGKPDVLASNRGPGTGNRIAVPVINIHKTRLNDPHLSLLGTNDHPGDYRSSGCTACHVVYANDRDPKHSGPYAKFGNEGFSQTNDPTIQKERSGHPLKHQFTRSIPTSQCMVCHMHQPNMFVNSFLGYTMWDYEPDAKFMWPAQQKYPSHSEMFESLEHNPEEAAVRGNWSDPQFLKNVSELNPQLKDTQFADYHGHGWNFRAVFKRDRKGHLLDANGKIVSFDDPQKFKKAVHMTDIHADYGMHCVDCHFDQDSHGDGHIYGEVAQAVEIQCEDCHGTSKKKATLKTSGPAAPPEGRDLRLMRTAFGDLRFYYKNGDLYQRSSLFKTKEWRVSQVIDSITPGSSDYNPKAARAKTLRKISDPTALAHDNDKIACFTCHSSWMTSCGGCHLPIQSNWKQKSKHYDGKTTRNWASYNPQVARDDVYQIGLHGPAKDNKIVPVRSSSALILSSTDINRQRIYIQQPPTAASGHSSQAFAPHFPHTVRKNETKTCTDCHISEAGDNNALLTQLFLFGTNFMGFMGFNAWVAAGEKGLAAIEVTEWDEPQAVIGSYLHRYAYPDYFKEHQKSKLRLKNAQTHAGAGGEVNTIQLRGEYVFTTAGSGGFRVYDVANIANKGFSERIVTSPFSPLGQDLHVPTKNATSFALPTTMPIAPFRKQLPENLETPLHPIYHYAFVADSEEGLILINVDTLQDGERRNNFLKRALTWNENGILNGAQFITMAGSNIFVLTKSQLVILDAHDPLQPKLISTLPFSNPKSLAIQFRYAFLLDDKGLHTIDITNISKPQTVKAATTELADARSISVARTYAYIAAGREGLVIVDIEKPEKPKVYNRFTADNKLIDVNDVKIASTNASLFAYVADKTLGLAVLQLTDPDRVPGFYGFSPEVKPNLISIYPMKGARALSKALDRDRAVDETGNQVSVFGRIGSRPLNLQEIKRFYQLPSQEIYKVRN